MLIEKGHASRFICINELYKKIVEEHTDLICRFLPDGTMTFVNNTYCKYFGKSRQELIGKKFTDFIPIAERERINNYIKNRNKKGSLNAIEHRVISADGEIRWQHWDDKAIIDDDGKIIEFQSVGRDITIQKQNELELTRYRDHLEELVRERTEKLNRINKQLVNEISEKEKVQLALERYQILAEKASDIILFFSLDGKIIEANEAAVQSYGYSHEELLQMTVYDLRIEEERKLVQAQLEQAYTKGILFETIHRKKDRSILFMQVNIKGTYLQGKPILLSIIRDISERKRMEKQLQYIARYDQITNIPNQFYMEQFIIDKCNQSKKIKGAFLLIGLDNFKMINDSYGQKVGEQVLRQFVVCLKANLGREDFLARISWGEFAVFLSQASLEKANMVAQKLLIAVEKKNFIINNLKSLKMTISVGVTMIEEITDLKHLRSYAGAALHMAKERGKNSVAILHKEEEKKKIAATNEILKMITDALNDNKFKLFLQPIHQMGNGVIHYEALIRMLDHQDKIIPPVEFIPIAERYGLMTAIDKWVFMHTLHILNSRSDLTIFINLSGESLGDESFLEWIDSTVKQECIEPERLGFEITETTAIKNLVKVDQWIRKIKAQGCCFALDDFGVGFSSFSYLHQLAVDFLKIDGSFVHNLDSNATNRALVQAMNAVAHTLGKKTIAEFIENKEVLDVLHEIGVDCFQGYYLGKPTPLEMI